MTQHSVFTRMRLAVPLAAALLLMACGNEEPPAPVEVRAPIQAISQIPLQDMVACAEDAAPLVDNTGTFSRSINTGMELAQAYFDQGLRLTYGYYFPEAIASFNAALCLDPNNAMIHWGRALAMGPNPNSRYAGVTDDPAGAGKAAIDRAMALADTLPPAERGLVEALAVLFDSETYPDVMARNNAFVEAAEANYQTHSDDLEAAFLVPHGIMMTTPWAYFSSEDGSALPGVARARDVIEQGMAQNPRHPGLTHLHIHLLEASFEPEAAEASADRLESLTPMIGHMVHMPGHIYMRLGRYSDSIATNQRSLEADEFLQQAWGNRTLPRNGTYFLSATNHGGHARMFIHWAGLLQGNFERASNVSQTMASMADVEALNRGSGLRAPVAHWMTLKAFGRYDDLLALQNPAPEQPYLAGMLHWVQGSAHAANGDLAPAQQALTALQSIRQSAAGLDTMRASVNTAEDLLAIAEHMLAGEIANAQQDYTAAVGHFEQAVALQDALRYMEPPDWLQSTRLFLGQALINAGQPDQAVSVFERDLLMLNENGWALQGLAQALERAGRSDEAEAVRERQAQAWADADVMLSAAHF
jgi:tetratricopeptide (TPR) repeat protein